MPDEKNKINILDYSLEELTELLVSKGYPKFRASQVYSQSYMYKHFDEMNIPKDLKDFLNENYYDNSVVVLETFKGKDDTEKYLFLFRDGNIVEGVFMPHKYGNTLCVSTQVGCRMGCKFCASTLNGLIRNLTCGEILGEVLAINKLHNGTLKERKITNIVLMGSGEPLDNFDEVVKFINFVSSKDGINISPRNISLSTCGLVDKIIKFADLKIPVILTISLHASTDETRKEIMPIANKYSIAEIINAAKYYYNQTGRRIIFEYSLIEGKNSTREEAKKLAKLLYGLNAHVNLINLNPVKERNLKGISGNSIAEFIDELTKNGISNTLRHSMGNDIGGACGQLRNNYINNPNNYFNKKN
ncbi:MAG: 23S rRNA (adenine(2503)-C(2))-methyltransferase RlmN [Clostridia bacterium]|nr:23S rRNA (adenine(2503)-C(2))-methyltransferase RlmN [Clostridia bacterium]